MDTIELATYFGIITSPASGSFNLTDPTSGELICDETGLPVKIRGQKNIKPYFEEHLDLWRKVYDKVYELLSKKEDSNILSYERMLGLDVDNLFGINIALESE
jgi:hypothetical protein